tara:strand:+ start:44306 stop:45541 length:1236 start_codon:yes stop_codon:yes gene_type:complete
MRLEVIKALDSADPFAEVRKAFSIPVNKIYLDGNSLGPLTLVAKQRALEVIEKQWGNDLIASWNLHDWINLPITVGEKIAPLLGASSNQTICCDSVSINLFKLITCALAGNPERTTILSTTNNFPTDLYVAEGIQGLLGENRCRLQLVENHELNSALKQKPGVLLLTQTDYRTGEIFDIEKLTSQAHANGTPVIWDLSHSVGVLPLEMDKWNVDFAVGCTYKYLNGGPGAPAFLYVAHNQQENCFQPLSGWMGHKAPFEFLSTYTASNGINKFLSGTPPILSMSVLDAALAVYEKIDIHQLREKSIQLTELFMSLLGETGTLRQLQLRSPISAKIRGSQLAFAHQNSFGISQALAAKQVIADFRSPDLLRFGFSPLTLRYEDIWLAVEALQEVMAEEQYLLPEYNKKLKVT